MKAIPLTPAGEPRQRQATAPVFTRIAIVGLDRTGRALGLAIRRAWPSALVVGVDGNDALERAIQSQAIDVGGSDLVMLRDVELIVLTGTPAQCAEALAAIGEQVPGSAVVTATCGADRAVMESARVLPPQLTFVGGGLVESARSPERADPTDPERIAGREWQLRPAAGGARTAAAVERLRAFVIALGAEPRVVSESDDRD